jgi:hypothetical protein
MFEDGTTAKVGVVAVLSDQSAPGHGRRAADFSILRRTWATTIQVLCAVAGESVFVVVLGAL